jgi:hypothetical protein
VGVEIVESDVKFAIREGGNDTVHKVEDIRRGALYLIGA